MAKKLEKDRFLHIATIYIGIMLDILTKWQDFFVFDLYSPSKKWSKRQCWA